MKDVMTVGMYFDQRNCAMVVINTALWFCYVRPVQTCGLIANI